MLSIFVMGFMRLYLRARNNSRSDSPNQPSRTATTLLWHILTAVEGAQLFPPLFLVLSCFSVQYPFKQGERYKAKPCILYYSSYLRFTPLGNKFMYTVLNSIRFRFPVHKWKSSVVNLTYSRLHVSHLGNHYQVVLLRTMPTWNQLRVGIEQEVRLCERDPLYNARCLGIWVQKDAKLTVTNELVLKIVCYQFYRIQMTLNAMLN